jgi:hypothetical protein
MKKIIAGIDVGLIECTVVFIIKDGSLAPFWLETIQWKKKGPIRGREDAENRISEAEQWLKRTLTTAGRIHAIGVETYIFQGRDRAANKWGPWVGRLAGIFEGISGSYANTYGISRNEAIRTIGATDSLADSMVKRMLKMPNDADQHSLAAALVGLAASIRAPR